MFSVDALANCSTAPLPYQQKYKRINVWALISPIERPKRLDQANSVSFSFSKIAFFLLLPFLLMLELKRTCTSQKLIRKQVCYKAMHLSLNAGGGVGGIGNKNGVLNLLPMTLPNIDKIRFRKRLEHWFSVQRRRLIIWRLWVRIPARNTEWTYICCKHCTVWLKRPK